MNPFPSSVFRPRSSSVICAPRSCAPLTPVFAAFACGAVLCAAPRAEARGRRPATPVWQWQAAPGTHLSDSIVPIHVSDPGYDPNAIKPDPVEVVNQTRPVYSVGDDGIQVVGESAGEADDDDTVTGIEPIAAPEYREQGERPWMPRRGQRLSQDGVRIAQTNPNQPAAAPGDANNTTPAAPVENPPALTVPLDPNSPNTPPVPNPPAGGTPTTPGGPTGAEGGVTLPGTGAPVTPPVIETPSPNEYEGREIVEVTVVGNRVVPESSVLGAVGLRRGGAYSPRQADIDRSRIAALGFFATVAVQVTPNLEDPDKVNLTYAVVENRVITKITFEGSRLLTVADLQTAVQSTVGNVLNTNVVNADVGRIQELYRSKGFAVVVTSARQLDDGTLVFTLQEGRIGRIAFEGNKKTRTTLLRQLVRTKPGDGFDQAKLRRDANTLYDTNYFEDVSYRVADDDQNPGQILVTYILKERRTGQFSVGVGFDSRSKINGFVTVGEQNFRGRGQNVSGSVELGSQRSFSVAYGDPFVGSRNASYNISAFSQRIIREPSRFKLLGIGGDTTSGTVTFFEQRTGARFNYTLPLDDDRYRNILFGYRNEDARFYRSDNSNSNNFQPIDLGRSQGRVSAFSLGFLRDRRDLRLDPSRGGREQAIIEQAIPALGDLTFTKLDVDLRRYIPLMGPQQAGGRPRLVFATRGVLGLSGGNLPIFEQYFIGGSDTVRGYDVDEQFGNSQAYANFELRYRLQRSLQVVAFSDVGRAFGSDFTTNSGLLFSVGAGLRLWDPLESTCRHASLSIL